jgi:beta-mannanase
MNKAIKWIAALAVIAMLVFAAFKFFYKNVSKQSAELINDAPLLAMFNHNDSATVNDFKNSNHILVRLTTGDKSIIDEIKKVWKPGLVILTVETWPGVAEKFQKENILTIVAKGSIDEKLKELSLFISKQNQPTLVRFNPDMEVYVNVFPWQKESSTMYANAFNHFAEIIKQNAPAAKLVWSPAGYPGAEEYWPGTKWVDMVSVTLKGKSELMTDNYPEPKDQQELIFRKLHRMRFFDKPVLVFGSAKLGKADFQQQAFDAAVNYIQQNKDIEYIDINAADKTISPANLRKDSTLITGVFDPSHSLVDSVSLSTEHLFVNIMALKSGEFKKKFDSIMTRNRNAIVTMEPWKDENLKKDPQLVENILKGSYNNLFDQLYAVIGATGKTIYLRWLHEMEIPITRYPWQSQNPIGYIKAYRYFVNYIRNKKPQHIYFVWGPAGDRGSMEFWPGSDVVDYTSIAIYGLPDKNITDHNQQESFNKIFKRKYNRIWFAHKPLFITEFGVKGPASYKAEWLSAAATTIEENKEITGVSYFNDTDNPKAWGNIEAPDWSVSPSAYKAFLKQLKTSVKQ